MAIQRGTAGQASSGTLAERRWQKEELRRAAGCEGIRSKWHDGYGRRGRLPHEASNAAKALFCLPPSEI
jgi:hypothetical protein